MRYTVLLAGLLVMLLAPLTAHAANGFLTEKSGLRAGPGDRYPRLAVVDRDVGIDLLGCLAGWNWCEVVSGGLHGWVKAGHIGTIYHGRRVVINKWGPRIGVVIVGFDERPYWDRYYYDRDFYIVRYGRPDDRRPCHDPDRDRDCHVIVRHHDHGPDPGNWDRDERPRRYDEATGQEMDSDIPYHMHNYNN